MLFVDEANASADEIPPLAFEYEDEVRGVLDRLRDDLNKRVADKAGAGKGSSKGKEKAVQLDDQQRKKMEDLVHKVSRACSMIAGSLARLSAETPTAQGT